MLYAYRIWLPQVYYVPNKIAKRVMPENIVKFMLVLTDLWNYVKNMLWTIQEQHMHEQFGRKQKRERENNNEP